ncbi:MAG: right-handed parallel beta-helix repeat-containing protein [Patescibacteria group bacterium]|jgi:uncharacterized repeat protein (TIGR01451 family)
MFEQKKPIYFIIIAVLTVGFVVSDKTVLASAVGSSSADISLVVKSDQSVDSSIVYTVLAQNNSDKNRSNVSVFVPVPTDIKYVADTATDGGQLNSSKNQLEWTLPSLPAGSSKLLTFKMSSVVSSSHRVIYVSPNGNDSWSGGLPQKQDNTNSGPFKTLEKARDTIRANKPLTHPYDVKLIGGTYLLDQTFNLTVEDSGTLDFPITYSHYDETKPILSGTTELADLTWSSYRDGIYKTALPANAPSDFSSLVINGSQATRARTPNKDVGDADYLTTVPVAYWPLSGENSLPLVAGSLGVMSDGRVYKCINADGCRMYSFDFDQPEKDQNFAKDFVPDLALQGLDPCTSYIYRTNTSTGVDDISPGLTDLDNVELATSHSYLESRFRIKSVDPTNKKVTINSDYVVDGQTYTQKINPNGGVSCTSSTQRYYLDNIFEGLDTPGEWYLKKSAGYREIYYYPRNDEKINQIKAEVPVLGKLVDIHNTDYLTFSGIDFTGTKWELPAAGAQDVSTLTRDENSSFDTGFKIRNSSGNLVNVPTSKLQYNINKYDAFEAVNSKNLVIKNCRFYNIGVNGIVLYGLINSEITDNELFNIGATPIVVSDYLINSDRTAARRSLYSSANNKITNNKVHDFGQVFKYSFGIYLVEEDNSIISHNEFYNGPYVGILVSSRMSSYSTIVDNNDVHNVMQGLNDGGGIYYIGSSSSFVENNYVHDIVKTLHHDSNLGLYGIYLDANQNQAKFVRNNIIDNTSNGFKFNDIRNCFIDNNLDLNSYIAQISTVTLLDASKWNLVPPVSDTLPTDSLFSHNIVYSNPKPNPYFLFSSHAVGKTQKNDPNNPLSSLSVSLFSIDKSDYNLYWPVSENYTRNSYWADMNFETWKDDFATDSHPSVEQNSIQKDPEFVDPTFADHNYLLKPTSPAFDIGFRQIEINDVGVRIVDPNLVGLIAYATYKNADNRSFLIISNESLVSNVGLKSSKIKLSADKKMATSNSIITYSLIYTNDSTTGDSNILVSALIPAGTVYVSDSVSGSGNYDADTRTISWRIAQQPPGASTTFGFRVKVN